MIHFHLIFWFQNFLVLTPIKTGLNTAPRSLCDQTFQMASIKYCLIKNDVSSQSTILLSCWIRLFQYKPHIDFISKSSNGKFTANLSKVYLKFEKKTILIGKVNQSVSLFLWHVIIYKFCGFFVIAESKRLMINLNLIQCSRWKSTTKKPMCKWLWWVFNWHRSSSNSGQMNAPRKWTNQSKLTSTNLVGPTKNHWVIVSRRWRFKYFKRNTKKKYDEREP